MAFVSKYYFVISLSIHFDPPDLTFGYHTSFQIRLQQVRGGDSVLSGIFFGKPLVN